MKKSVKNHRFKIMTFLLILVIAGYIMLNYLNSPSTKLKSNEYEIVSSLPEIENNSWQQSITSEEYYILVEKGTERPFSGELLENKKSGTYLTAGCNLPVFSSETKFDSGTGWPSFTSPISNNNIILKKDYSLGIERVEVLSSCGEHLGHVFPDGPEPDGLRFCINSKALKFIEN